MREWDDNVLVDEDEQSQEKTQTNRTEGIHSWKLIKLWVVEDGTIVDTKDWNWMEKQEPKKKKKKITNNGQIETGILPPGLRTYHNQVLALNLMLVKYVIVLNSCKIPTLKPGWLLC